MRCIILLFGALALSGCAAQRHIRFEIPKPSGITISPMQILRRNPAAIRVDSIIAAHPDTNIRLGLRRDLDRRQVFLDWIGHPGLAGAFYVQSMFGPVRLPTIGLNIDFCYGQSRVAVEALLVHEYAHYRDWREGRLGYYDQATPIEEALRQLFDSEMRAYRMGWAYAAAHTDDSLQVKILSSKEGEQRVRHYVRGYVEGTHMITLLPEKQRQKVLGRIASSR